MKNYFGVTKKVQNLIVSDNIDVVFKMVYFYYPNKRFSKSAITLSLDSIICFKSLTRSFS